MGALLNSIVLVLIALCVHRAFRIYTITGMSAHNHPHRPGPCQEVKGIQMGSEDFEIISSGQAFISSGLRYSYMSPKSQEHFKRQGIRGAIYLLNLRPSNGTQPWVPAAQELQILSSPLFEADSFAPHGLSVWEDRETGRHVLFVVNHRVQTGPIDSRVEKFIYDPDRQALEHLATYTDPSMMLVNDVQATGEDSFYFTNSCYSQHVLGALLELLLELTLTNVVHYDGQTYTVVDSGLKSANGITMSTDKKVVYVADIVSREILVYRRNPNNSLTRMQDYPVYTWPDNLQVDHSTGHLYTACHIQPLQFFFHHAEDIAINKSPSQVLQLQVKNGRITSSLEVLYDHGQLISGASSALFFEGTLLIGSVFDRMVTCQVHSPLLQ